jgi:hypothetical protein
MARKAGGFRTGETTELRAIAGAIAIDSATLSDANYPAVAGKLTGGIDCSGYDTVLIGVEVVVPGTSSMTIEALFFDPDGAVDQKLSRVLLGAPPGITTIGALAAETTGALPGQETQFAELRVFGHPQVFFRVTAVLNSGGTTSSKILGRPGRVRGDRRLNLPFAATP